MSRDIKISVIIPVYKVEPYLSHCIQSVINQTHQNIEIILVDDGSPDACGKICDDYSEKDSRIHVFHQRNQGLSAARNKGLMYATGKYFAFVDSDDFIHPRMLETLLELCITKECDIAQCGFETGISSCFSTRRNHIKVQTCASEDAFRSRTLKVMSWGKLYRRDLYDGIQFPENKVNEDEFVTYKLVYKAKKIVFTNEILYYYFQNQNGIIRRNNTFVNLDVIDAYRERLNYFQNFKEYALKELTHREFAIRLILLYGRCYRNRSISQNLLQAKYLLDIFRNNLRKIMNMDNISFKYKVFFRIYSICPHTVIAILNKIKSF